MSRVSRRDRTFVVAALGLALLLAGAVSLVASGHPDGLEHVAATHGFLDSARDSVTAASPLADYGVTGLGSPRLSTAVAGVVGVLLTFGLVALLPRRRD